MGELFSASEIVQIGIQIERNGRDLYKGLAESQETNKVKEVFRFLAQEEERHIKVFQDILRGFESYEPKEAFPEEYFAYLTSLSKDHVFSEEKSGVRLARNIRDDTDAIDLGIDFEKDSILFYHEIRDLVWNEGKGIIDKLIKEERGHLRKLWDIRGRL